MLLIWGSLQLTYYAVYYAAENSDSDQDILMQTSTDNGATWSSPATVAGATTTGRDGMPGVAQYTYNGANYLVCVFETTEGTGTFTVKSVYSTDDGATWGTRSQVFVPTGTDNNGQLNCFLTTHCSHIHCTRRVYQLVRHRWLRRWTVILSFRS